MPFIDRLIQAMDSHNVPYALVGGWAVALHGAPRGTFDVDFIIEHTAVSFSGCESALRSTGLEPRLPVTAHEVFEFREEYIQRRNMIAWGFVNPRNPLEVADVVLTHDLKAHAAVSKKYGLGRIRVLSLRDLIEMKKKSGRPQDLEDVKMLESLK